MNHNHVVRLIMMNTLFNIMDYNWLTIFVYIIMKTKNNHYKSITLSILFQYDKILAANSCEF